MKKQFPHTLCAKLVKWSISKKWLHYIMSEIIPCFYVAFLLYKFIIMHITSAVISLNHYILYLFVFYWKHYAFLQNMRTIVKYQEAWSSSKLNSLWVNWNRISPAGNTANGVNIRRLYCFHSAEESKVSVDKTTFVLLNSSSQSILCQRCLGNPIGNPD